MTIDAGLLIARLVFGLVMAGHGAQKLFGWFGGYGIAGTGGFLESLGFRPGRFFAAAAALSELGGGVLIAAGLLGPVGPALMLSAMIVAAISVHLKGGLFAQSNGIELPLLYGAVAISLALTGPGAYSLDALLGLGSLSRPVVSLTVLAAATAGAIVSLAARRQPAQASA